MDLPDEVRARYLHRIYERTTVEDFDTLHDLGFLEAEEALLKALFRKADEAKAEGRK